MTLQARTLQLTALKSYQTRTELFEGREHLVVPVVALVEGVVHAMNATNAEFVPAEEFTKAPGGWNGRPIFLGHPVREGLAVSGNDPEILEEERIGTIFNTKIRSNKLTMEAWIDVERATEKAPTLLERVRNKEDIEISVGVFTGTDDAQGEYNGKRYNGSWKGIMPDHLALLPETDLGACSVAMGCGVRAATANSKGVNVKDQNGMLTRVMSLLRGTGILRSAMSTEDMTNSDLLRKLYEAVKAKYPNAQYTDLYYPATNPTNVVFTCSHPSPATSGPDCYSNGYSYKMYDQGFTLDASGVVTLTGEAEEVEPVMRYEPVNRAASDAEPKIAASAKPCSCQHPSAEEKVLMKTKQERVTALIGKSKTFVEADRAMLEAASDEQLARFEAASEAPAPAAAPPAAPVAAPAATPAPAPAAAPVVEEQPKVAKAPSFDDLLKAADPATRESIEAGIRTAKVKKAATVKALKDTGRCKVTDEALNAMSQDQLDQLVELAGSNVRAAIDYSGQGGPKDGASEPKEAPAPTDLGASIRAARGQK